MKKTTKRRHITINLAGICLVFILLAIAAVRHSGMIFGYSVTEQAAVEKVKMVKDTVKINTTDICPDVNGYVGLVPVEITVVNDSVSGVMALENKETPRFFQRVVDSGILDSWNGLSVNDAIVKDVDAVTRATYSSKAVIENVRRGLATYEPTTTKPEEPRDKTDPAMIVALIVLIVAMIVPLFFKNKIYRIVQQILNAGVLGFWTGTFISYTMLLQVVEMGVMSTLITVLLFIVVFIYPLFGKKGYYCAWICPLGSLQELASKCNPKHHLKLSNKAISILTTFRKVLWGVLMICLLTGIWTSWIDYELFTSFAVNVAPIGVIIAGAIFIILSVWIPRPYCRFVCPTGTLIKLAEDSTKR